LNWIDKRFNLGNCHSLQSLQLCWITIFLLSKKYNLLLLSSTVQDWIIIRKILLDLLEYNWLICINALSISCLSSSHQAFGTDIWIFWDRYLDLLGQSTNWVDAPSIFIQLSMTIKRLGQLDKSWPSWIIQHLLGLSTINWSYLELV